MKHYHVKTLFDSRHVANSVQAIEDYLNQESEDGYDFVDFDNDRDYPTVITAKEIV